MNCPLVAGSPCPSPSHHRLPTAPGGASDPPPFPTDCPYKYQPNSKDRHSPIATSTSTITGLPSPAPLHLRPGQELPEHLPVLEERIPAAVPVADRAEAVGPLVQWFPTAAQVHPASVMAGVWPLSVEVATFVVM